MEVKPALLSEDQISDYCGGLSRSSVYRLRRAGEIESLTIGRRRYYPVESVDAYIARRRAAVSA